MLRTGWLRGCSPHISLTARVEWWPVFAALLVDLHQLVAPLRPGQVFSYAYRTARQSPLWSDHAAGVAVDYNSASEGAPGPHGGMYTMTHDQIQACAGLRQLYRILIWGGDARRGGDYVSPSSWDPMHWAARPGSTVEHVNIIRRRLLIDDDGTRRTRHSLTK